MRMRYEDMLALLDDGRTGSGGDGPDPSYVPSHLRAEHRSVPGKRISPPGPSRASRTISRSSRRSMRLGTARPEGRDDYDSALEHKAANVLLADPRVADVQGQPQAVTVVDRTGRTIRHTPDLAAKLRDGRTVGVLVRPERRASGMAGLVGLLAERGPPGGAAGYAGWTHVSEVPLTRDVVHQADLVDWVRRDGPTSACPEVVRMREALDRRMTVSEAIAASGTGPDGFRAVVRLVADREARVVDGWRIHHAAVVEPLRSDVGGAR